MILPKIVMIIALISGLTMLTSGTQQTFAVMGVADGGGSVRASGSGGMGGGGSTGGSIGQSVDPHLAEKICKNTGMLTPLCK